MFLHQGRCPHFAYILINALPTNTLDRAGVLLIEEWISFPLSISSSFAHAFRADEYVNGLGATPSPSISFKYSRASYSCPKWAQPEIIAVHETTSLIGIS
uniref:Uncharacterized protein n=1 Tax=Solanum lycopersicum TaxID=4081 RepID=A0A3Q7HEG4_SOLLC